MKKLKDEIEENKLDEFDIEQAEKLLENINILKDLTKFPVRMPNNISLELKTMKEWIKWYTTVTQWNGRDGTENEVMKIIVDIDNDLQIMAKRIEEALRVLITVLERKDIRIELLTNKLNIIEEEMRLLKNPEKQVEEVKEVEPVEEIKKNTEEKLKKPVLFGVVPGKASATFKKEEIEKK